LDQILRPPGVDEGVLDNTLFVWEQCTGSPGRDGFIGIPDKGDNESFHGIDELLRY
jgi:hypothetical protein